MGVPCEGQVGLSLQVLAAEKTAAVGFTFNPSRKTYRVCIKQNFWGGVVSDVFLYLTMKLYLVLLFVFSIDVLKAQTVPDTTTNYIFQPVERLAGFPGGTEALNQYVRKNLEYPESASLLGIGGKVTISFIVEKNGELTDFKALSSVGAGCENEAIRLMTDSPKWLPYYPESCCRARVRKTIDIFFKIPKLKKIRMRKLVSSNIGFVFLIDGKVLETEEAEKIIGRTFDKKIVESADLYPNSEKYSFPNKKEVYLITIRSKQK